MTPTLFWHPPSRTSVISVSTVMGGVEDVGYTSRNVCGMFVSPKTTAKYVMLQRPW